MNGKLGCRIKKLVSFNNVQKLTRVKYTLNLELPYVETFSAYGASVMGVVSSGITAASSGGCRLEVCMAELAIEDE
jgi:hypothetical protein